VQPAKRVPSATTTEPTNCPSSRITSAAFLWRYPENRSVRPGRKRTQRRRDEGDSTGVGPSRLIATSGSVRAHRVPPRRSIHRQGSHRYWWSSECPQCGPPGSSRWGKRPARRRGIPGHRFKRAVVNTVVAAFTVRIIHYRARLQRRRRPAALQKRTSGSSHPVRNCDGRTFR